MAEMAAAGTPATGDHDQPDGQGDSRLRVPLWRRLCTLLGVPGRVAIGGILAVVFGVTCREVGATAEMFVEVVALPGTIWLRLLKMVVLPLVFANVVEAVANLRKVAGGGRIGIAMTAYYTLTTLLACVEGLAFSSVIMIMLSTVGPIQEATLPEAVLDAADEAELASRDVWEQFKAVLMGFTPPNIVAAAAEGDLLGVVSFAIMFALAIPLHPDGRESVVVGMLHEVSTAMFRLIGVLIIFTPFGVFSLVSERLIQVDIADIIHHIGIFLATVFAGLAFHNIVTYPALYFCFTSGKNPGAYIKGIVPAMLTALGTSSSAATLPVTMQCAIENNKMPPTLAKLVLSLGATVNMDGTAIGFPTAVIFLAAAQGIELSFLQMVTVAVVSALCSFGAAPIPSAGLVLLTTVLEAADVPANGLFGLIIAVDWIYDRLETMTNIVGDSIALGIMAHRFGAEAGMPGPEEDAVGDEERPQPTSMGVADGFGFEGIAPSDGNGSSTDGLAVGTTPNGRGSYGSHLCGWLLSLQGNASR